MEIAESVSVETDFLCLVGEHLDGRLVVEDHLGLFGGFAFGTFAEIKKSLSLEHGVSIAFQAA